MNFLAVRNNNGGKTGHKLKEQIGGMILANILGLEFRWIGHESLLPFGFDNIKPLSKTETLEATVVSSNQGESWKLRDESVLSSFPIGFNYVLGGGFVVHPFQAIKWGFQAAYDNTVKTLNSLFERGNPRRLDKRHCAAIHVNHRIHSYQKLNNVTIKMCHHIPSVEYYLNTVRSCEENGYEPHAIMESTKDHKYEDALLDAGAVVVTAPPREESSHSIVMDNFRRFVEADLLVASHSSFSVAAIYFREKRESAYFPHNHIQGIPGIILKEDGSWKR